jgi:hypothetical protein
VKLCFYLVGLALVGLLKVVVLIWFGCLSIARALAMSLHSMLEHSLLIVYIARSLCSLCIVRVLVTNRVFVALITLLFLVHYCLHQVLSLSRHCVPRNSFTCLSLIKTNVSQCVPMYVTCVDLKVLMMYP